MAHRPDFMTRYAAYPKSHRSNWCWGHAMDSVLPNLRTSSFCCSRERTPSKYAAKAGSLSGDNDDSSCVKEFPLEASDDGVASSNAETAFCLLSIEICE